MERQRRRKKSSIPGFLSPRSENLLSSPQDESSAIINKQRYKINAGQTDGGRHSTVMFASKTPDSNNPRKEFAIKKQVIKSPVNLSDRAYREVYILQQLNKLKERSEYYPSGVTNFVDLVEWFKGKDDSQYMHYVLEKADLTLYDLRENPLPLPVYRSILFQTLFALLVAQETCEFMHNDLHPKNILLVKAESRRPNEKVIYFRYGDQQWAIDDYLVKITDFGLSRIKLDKRIVYDKRMPYMKGFLRTKDVGEVFDEFSKIRISPNSWVTEEELAELLPKSTLKKRQELREELEKKRRNELKDLRRLGRNDALLSQMIQHPFFAPLRREDLQPQLKTPRRVSPPRPLVNTDTPPSAIISRKRKLSFNEALNPDSLLADAFEEISLQDTENRRSQRLNGRHVTTYERPKKIRRVLNDS